MFENLVVHKNQTIEGLASRAPFFVIDKVNRPEKMAKVFFKSYPYRLLCYYKANCRSPEEGAALICILLVFQ